MDALRAELNSLSEQKKKLVLYVEHLNRFTVCWEPVNRVESNVFTLTRIGSKAWDLYGRGIIDSADIPADFKLTDKQRLQQRVERDGVPHVDREAVRDFLGRLVFPLYLLDFETFGTAIPRVEGTRPYEQVPFQLSLHVAPALDAEPRHYSRIWDGKGDPREEMLTRLSTFLGRAGSVVAYNASLEPCMEGRPGRRDQPCGTTSRNTAARTQGPCSTFSRSWRAFPPDTARGTRGRTGSPAPGHTPRLCPMPSAS